MSNSQKLIEKFDGCDYDNNNDNGNEEDEDEENLLGGETILCIYNNEK